MTPWMRLTCKRIDAHVFTLYYICVYETADRGGSTVERKPNAASDQTKHALAEALKTLMAQKPFDKITIRDISELAGIRRQNFYYHFEDVYDLMRWMF